ncbi:MAG: C40 family peptidase [Myxococcales bacterium]|nr:C40 family peptidase [Myxococcales bacterium]MCL4756330.1 C40 family peptidase [Myxococcales bacterium]
MSFPERTLAAAERAVVELRHDLERAFGWTLIDVHLSLGPNDHGLIARGTVVVPRVARRVRAALLDAVPEGWPVDTSALVALGTGDWRALGDTVTPVWQKQPSRARSLSTELLPEDGPVELLAIDGGASLVRAIDATVGWIDHELGATSVPAPRIEAACGTADAVVAAARVFLGAPYRLGGATREGIDCSALVARAFLRGFTLRLPRHSTDQLASTMLPGHAPELTGDLLFAWTEREGPCHVGIVVEGDPMTVIHASHSRKQVVEDPVARFLDGALRSEVAPLSRVLEFHAKNVGRSSLELPSEEPEIDD